MRGGWARQRAQCSSSVASSGSPQIAAAGPEELDLGPAIGAKAVDFVDDRAAAARSAAEARNRAPASTGAISGSGAAHPRLVAQRVAPHKRRRGGPTVRHETARAAPRPRRRQRPGAVPARARVRRLPRAARRDQRAASPRVADRLPRPGLARSGSRQFAEQVESSTRARCSPPRQAPPCAIEDRARLRPRQLRPRASRSARSTPSTTLPRALQAARACAAARRRCCIGAISGGDTLPLLRAAMRAADTPAGAASPHVHPRIEAAALAPLLAARRLRHAGGRCRPRAGRLSVARPAGRAICAAMARPTSSPALAPAAAARRLGRGRRAFRAAGERRANRRDLRNPAFRRMDAGESRLKRPLTASRCKLVNSTAASFGSRGPGPEEGGVDAIRTILRRLLADQRGATAIEYGLIAALIVDRDDRRAVARWAAAPAACGPSISDQGRARCQR